MVSKSKLWEKCIQKSPFTQASFQAYLGFKYLAFIILCYSLCYTTSNLVQIVLLLVTYNNYEFGQILLVGFYVCKINIVIPACWIDVRVGHRSWHLVHNAVWLFGILVFSLKIPVTWEFGGNFSQKCLCLLVL